MGNKNNIVSNNITSINTNFFSKIQALIIAFLISPYGLPKIALWITAYIGFARDRLKEI